MKILTNKFSTWRLTFSVLYSLLNKKMDSIKKHQIWGDESIKSSWQAMWTMCKILLDLLIYANHNKNKWRVVWIELPGVSPIELKCHASKPLSLNCLFSAFASSKWTEELFSVDSIESYDSYLSINRRLRPSHRQEIYLKIEICLFKRTSTYSVYMFLLGLKLRVSRKVSFMGFN